MQQSNNQSPIYYPCMVLCWHFSCNTIFGVKEVCVRCVSPPTTKPTEDASCVQAIFFALYLTHAEDFPRSCYLLVKFAHNILIPMPQEKLWIKFYNQKHCVLFVLQIILPMW